MATFDATANATADGSGNATATLTGPPWGQLWTVTRITVTVPSMASTAIVPTRVYRNSATASNQVSATRTGQLDTDTDPRVTLAPGEQLLVVWTSATPGARCTVNIAYTVTVP